MKKSHHNPQTKPLNLKSLRTRFALRFLKALKSINQNCPKVAQRYHKIKVVADASLASAVGSRRAWSRAMLLGLGPKLSSGRRLARRQIILRRRRPAGPVAQAEELRRLVPGGEAMDLQSLLDETAHYIKCLTTQVKVMSSIVNYCSTP